MCEVILERHSAIVAQLVADARAWFQLYLMIPVLTESALDRRVEHESD